VGTQVKSATIGACAVLFVVLVAAAGAQADSFTWLGPTSLITTGGTKALTNVSCTSAQGANTSLCTTVDRSGQEITFDSSTGTIISRATVDLGLKVSSVSCVSSNQCFAVDDGGNELAFNPQNGSPIGAGLNHLEGHPLTSVSCSSATTCVTVDGSGNDVLFNPNNGASHIESIDVAALRAVSCAPMATQCTAVDATGHEITFTPGSTRRLQRAELGFLSGRQRLHRRRRERQRGLVRPHCAAGRAVGDASRHEQQRRRSAHRRVLLVDG
jgi:hypothetical protein